MNENEDIKITSFNPKNMDWDTLPKFFTLTLASPRNSGKNVAMKSLLYELQQKRDYHLVILFSGTHHLQDDAYNFIPKTMRFHPDMLEKKVNEILRIQQKIIKEKNGDKNKVPSVLIILDDIQASHSNGKGFRSNKSVEKLFLEGRHSCISCILCLQSLNGMNPNLRKNSEAIGVFRSSNYHQNKMIIEKYLCYENSLDTRKKGMKYMDNIFNEPYKMMVICCFKSQEVNSLEDFVFQYKADINRVKKMKFKLGHRSFWNNRNDD